MSIKDKIKAFYLNQFHSIMNKNVLLFADTLFTKKLAFAQNHKDLNTLVLNYPIAFNREGELIEGCVEDHQVVITVEFHETVDQIMVNFMLPENVNRLAPESYKNELSHFRTTFKVEKRDCPEKGSWLAVVDPIAWCVLTESEIKELTESIANEINNDNVENVIKGMVLLAITDLINFSDELSLKLEINNSPHSKVMLDTMSIN